jgi:hypothetical protein
VYTEDVVLPQKENLFLAFLRLPLSPVHTSYSLAWQHADAGSARGMQRHLKTYQFLSHLLNHVSFQCASKKKSQSDLDRLDLIFACPHGTKRICSKDRIAGEANSAAHTCSTSWYRNLGSLAHTHDNECRMVAVHAMVPAHKCSDLAK